MKVVVVLSILTSFAILNGCDEVGSPFEKPKTVETIDTTGMARKVFLEEFTGQSCKNCPDGHKVASDLRALYGERIVTMAIHAGTFARPDSKYPKDYRTPEGDEIKSKFPVSFYPAGMVNRQKIDGQVIQSAAAWPTYVAAAMNTPAKFKLRLAPAYKPSTGEVEVMVVVQTQAAVTTTKPVNIALYVVEDSIVSPQLYNDSTIVNYVHRDMLRMAPLGALGNVLTGTTTIEAKAQIVNTYRFSVAGKSWDIRHCKLIAMICEQDPVFNVLQVEETMIPF